MKCRIGKVWVVDPAGNFEDGIFGQRGGKELEVFDAGVFHLGFFSFFFSFFAGFFRIFATFRLFFLFALRSRGHSDFEEVVFHEPQVPVVANSSFLPLTTAAEVQDELIDGLCHCVQWRNSVRYMVDSGVSRFVEFGPARVLAGLIKRIDRDVQAVSLSDPDSIRKLSEGVV